MYTEKFRRSDAHPEFNPKAVKAALKAIKAALESGALEVEDKALYMECFCTCGNTLKPAP